MAEMVAGPVQPGKPYMTLDGSLISELVRPERGGSRNVSVAVGVIEPGERTRPHRHTESDEVYYVLSGKGVVTLGEKCYAVGPGSCVLTPAGHVHSVRCTGNEALRILCICAPPYTHEQTSALD